MRCCKLAAMIGLLLENPLLLLFLVIGVGYVLGRIEVAGTSLGVAAVLFAGLGFGALHADLKLPEIVYELGLVLFVYAIGLSSGPGFVAAFRRRGLSLVALTAGIVAIAAAMAAAAHYLFDLSPALTAGLFTGSLTNTPALAGAVEYVTRMAPPGAPPALLDEPVVGYSIAYPLGVLVPIATIAIARRIWRVDYAEDAAGATISPDRGRSLGVATVRVTHDVDGSATPGEIARANGWDVVFGRVKRGSTTAIVDPETRLRRGDLVTIIGPAGDVEGATAHFGVASDERIELDRKQLDYRRIFVSNRAVAGQPLRDLALPQRFGAVITRVRRGDVEMVPHADTVLELGDRVRVVTSRENMPAVSHFFGDSYRAVSEMDILTFSLGLCIGLLVGLVPVPLPGGLTFRLGIAGGPLVVALVLGTLQRTGPLVWTIPYGVNQTLRQLGLMLFFAGIGTRAGYSFVATLGSETGPIVLASGAAVVAVASLATLWVAHKLLRLPFGTAIGILGGMQTQPAVLSFALDESGNELPNVGYASVFPLAMIVKILLAQALLALL
jgi:putative transport protein